MLNLQFVLISGRPRRDPTARPATQSLVGAIAYVQFITEREVVVRRAGGRLFIAVVQEGSGGGGGVRLLADLVEAGGQNKDGDVGGCDDSGVIVLIGGGVAT